MGCKPNKSIPLIEILNSEFIFSDPPFDQCHASTICELTDNRLMAAWFAGTYERHPDVSIWISVYEGNKWSRPKKLADGVIDDITRYPCWNPVLFKNNAGTLYLYYKVGPSPSEWWGMFMASDDEGITWSSPTLLPDGLIGPVRCKPITLADGTWLSPSSIERGDIWHAHIEISSDDGASWQKIQLDSSTGYKIIQPTLIIHRDMSITALMRSNINYIVESKSTDDGRTWSIPTPTDVLNPNAGIDALTLGDGRHLMVYNPMKSGTEWFDGRSKLYLLLSEDDGQSWLDVLKLEDNDEGEFSYPAIIRASDGTIHISYTSDRSNIRYLRLKLND